MDANTVYSTLRDGTPEARRALLDALPRGVGRPAVPLLSSDQPGMRVLASLSPVIGPFFQRFYELWLGKRMSRASALAQAVTELRNGGAQLAAPESWAAFRLTGDWR